jgi:hypothetical protein
MVVVTDLGSLKAYRVTYTRVRGTPRLELVESFEPASAHEKLTDRLSDQAGRYRVPGGRMAMSYGENHKIQLELRKRLVKQLARQLNTLLREDGLDACYLAASKEINHQLLNELEPPLRRKITKNVPADLTKLDKSELLERLVNRRAE